MSVTKVFYFVAVFCFVLQIGKCDDDYSDILNKFNEYLRPEDVQLLSEIFANYSKEHETTSRERRDTLYTPYNNTQDSDCFGWGWVGSLIRNTLNNKPANAEDLNIIFRLQTRQTLESRKKPSRIINPRDKSPDNWKDFKADKPVVVIVHGYSSHGLADWVLGLKSSLLLAHDVNVILPDWSDAFSTFTFWRAIANTRTAGSELAVFLKTMMEVTGQTNIHLIGHSVGAHMCAFAANILGGVKRITGLDPAFPCFDTDDKNVILDASDAEFVDIIHTNGRADDNSGVGILERSGHQDFYPNGGKIQPGCEVQSLSETYNPLRYAAESFLMIFCNHGRAYRLLRSSLRKHNCKLMGHLWDQSEESKETSLSTPCDETNCALMGFYAENNLNGAFYLKTSGGEPYC